MKLRIHVDRSACAGHALCAAREPEVFTLDPDGYCSADGALVPLRLKDGARRGMQVCPESAITLSEEPSRCECGPSGQTPGEDPPQGPHGG